MVAGNVVRRIKPVEIAPHHRQLFRTILMQWLSLLIRSTLSAFCRQLVCQIGAGSQLCRPPGNIDRDKAHWLVTTLSAGEGPTPLAQKIAFEVVREAESCDEALVGFALRKADARIASAPTAQRVVLAS